MMTTDPGAAEFKTAIIGQFFRDVHHMERNDEYIARFGAERANQFDLAKHVAGLDWFFENWQNLYLAYARLADEESRNLFASLIRFRLAGHAHVRVAAKVPEQSSEARHFRETFTGTPSQLDVAGMFGQLVHYDRDWDGVRYVVDTIKDSLLWTLVYRQYFLERDGIRIRPEAGDYVVDGGACTGDTAVVFSKAVGPEGRVFAFEPVAGHIDICNHNFSQPGYENVTLLPYGLSDQAIEAPPVSLDAYDPGWRVQGIVPLARIDDQVIDGRIPRVTFIKLDIEGSELAALRGAVATIRLFKPKLAISIYHKFNDYFEIVNYLHDLNLGYRFHLGHYTAWDAETVLYAQAR
jgi:FkbM family methyltransferase